jgi:hypothetical protein
LGQKRNDDGNMMIRIMMIMMITIAIVIARTTTTTTTTRLVLVANAMEQSPTTVIIAPKQHKMRPPGVTTPTTTTVDCHAVPIHMDPTVTTSRPSSNPPPVRRRDETTTTEGGAQQGHYHINAERGRRVRKTATTGFTRRPITEMVAAVNYNQYQLPALIVRTKLLRGGTTATSTTATSATTADGTTTNFGGSGSRRWFGRVMFWSLGPAIVIMPFWMLLGRTLMGGPGGWMTLLLMKYVCPVMFFYHIVLWYVLFGVIVDRRTATTIRDFGVSDRFGFVLLGYYATAFCQQVFMSDWGDEELIMPSVAEAFLGINAKWCDHIHALLFLSLPLWMFLMLIMACYDRDEEPTGVSVPSSVHSA